MPEQGEGDRYTLIFDAISDAIGDAVDAYRKEPNGPDADYGEIATVHAGKLAASLRQQSGEPVKYIATELYDTFIKYDGKVVYAGPTKDLT